MWTSSRLSFYPVISRVPYESGGMRDYGYGEERGPGLAGMKGMR